MSTVIRKLLQQELGRTDYQRVTKFVWEEMIESAGGTPEHEALKKLWDAILDDESYDTMCLRKYGTNSFQYHCVDAKIQDIADKFCSQYGYVITEVIGVLEVLGPDLLYYFELKPETPKFDNTELKISLFENKLILEVEGYDEGSDRRVTMETESYDVTAVK